MNDVTNTPRRGSIISRETATPVRRSNALTHRGRLNKPNKSCTELPDAEKINEHASKILHPSKEPLSDVNRNSSPPKIQKLIKTSAESGTSEIIVDDSQSLFSAISKLITSSQNQEIIKKLAPGSDKLFQLLSSLQQKRKELQNKQIDMSILLRKCSQDPSKTSLLSCLSNTSNSTDLLDSDKISSEIFFNEYASLKCRLEIVKLFASFSESLVERPNFTEGGYFDKLQNIIRKALIGNIQKMIRKRKYEISSFKDVEVKLHWNLYERKMQTDDVKRALSDTTVHICVNGVDVDFNGYSPTERFNLILTLFSSQFFYNPKMFDFLADELAYNHKSQDMFRVLDDFKFSNYQNQYDKLMDMTDKEKATIKTNFEQAFGDQISFNKVLKYFKLCQNIMGQPVIYFVTAIFINMRFMLFDKIKRGLTSPNLPLDRNRNEIFITFKDRFCEIRFLRKDSLIVSEAILLQEYSFIIDIDNDKIKLEKFDLNVTCSRKLVSNKEELSDLLFDLDILMESILSTNLKIQYTDENL